MPLVSPPIVTITAAVDRKYKLFAALFFVGLFLAFHFPSLNWLPRGIHEWAQADRLALAISFYDNGLNFFRPQTLNLSSTDGVVGVEFPLIPYMAAIGAKLTGRGSLIVWYRSLNIVIACVGCYYLFCLVFERTRQFITALVPGVFLATSPVFAYYAGNFLPDPTSTSLTVIAAYYLLNYHQHLYFHYLVKAIVLFTLAALIKTSSIIYLMAALGTGLLWTYLQTEVLSLRQKLLLMALCAGCLGVIIGYILFNRHLNEVYNSVQFLAEARPIDTAQQYQVVTQRIKEVWMHEYFTKAHYFMLEVSAAICLLSLPRIVRTDWLWASQLVLAAVGGWAFFWLMGIQLADHDYYVLAPYWPALVLLIALASVQVAFWQIRAERWNVVFCFIHYPLFGAALLALLILGISQYRIRTSDPYRPFSDYYTYKWMQGGAASLKAANIPSTATLLVLGEDAPNMSLVYFDRRGIVWNPDINQLSSAEVLSTMTTSGLDHLLMRQEIFKETSQKHPDIFRAFTCLINNDQYVLLKRIGAPKHW